jgi:ribosomal protein L37AE/L43A
MENQERKNMKKLAMRKRKYHCKKCDKTVLRIDNRYWFRSSCYDGTDSRLYLVRKKVK